MCNCPRSHLGLHWEYSTGTVFGCRCLSHLREAEARCHRQQVAVAYAYLSSECSFKTNKRPVVVPTSKSTAKGLKAAGSRWFYFSHRPTPHSMHHTSSPCTSRSVSSSSAPSSDVLRVGGLSPAADRAAEATRKQYWPIWANELVAMVVEALARTNRPTMGASGLAGLASCAGWAPARRFYRSPGTTDATAAPNRHRSSSGAAHRSTRFLATAHNFATTHRISQAQITLPRKPSRP
ncbi:hypothetical protein B0J18DRAFT_298149 [Chaetomium sp. MPI-SDFR-AT-0129]|nr:hypothetical protein B0J18DRAFT_298149 [Chaetomium sp. MPI-SDFR-AT-0129]